VRSFTNSRILTK